MKDEATNYQSTVNDLRLQIEVLDAYLHDHVEPVNDDYVINETAPRDDLGKQYVPFVFLSLFGSEMVGSCNCRHKMKHSMTPFMNWIDFYNVA
jgi:hypothetical protein